MSSRPGGAARTVGTEFNKSVATASDVARPVPPTVVEKDDSDCKRGIPSMSMSHRLAPLGPLGRTSLLTRHTSSSATAVATARHRLEVELHGGDRAGFDRPRCDLELVPVMATSRW